MNAREGFNDAAAYGRTDRSAINMVAYAIADLADALREHTAAVATPAEMPVAGTSAGEAS